MTTEIDGARIPRRDVSQLNTSLRRMWSYVSWALQNSIHNANREVEFAWDWEMFHEAASAGSASAIFGGHLWHALDCLERSGASDGKWKVVLTEGTRRELLAHLTRLLSELHARNRDFYEHSTSSRSSFRRTRLQEFSKHSEWTEVIETLSKLVEAEEKVRRIAILLERYTRPAPLPLEAVPTREIEHYQDLLDEIRPEAEGPRNVADAYNLACVEHLGRRSHQGSTMVTLVTATNAVRLADKLITIDPMQFAFESELRGEFPNSDARMSQLLTIQTSLNRQLLTLRRHRISRAEDVDNLSRNEVKAFLRDVEAISEDPVLERLGRLMNRMEQAARNAVAQLNARRMPDANAKAFDERESRFESVLQHVYMALRAVEADGITVSDLGLRIHATDEFDDVIQFEVHDGNARTIIQAEHSAEALAARWETEETIDGFLNCASWLAERLCLPEECTVSVRTSDGGERRSVRALGASAAWRAAVQLAGDLQIATIVLSWPNVALWYQAHAPVPNTKSRVTPVRLSVRVRGENPDLDCISQLYARTATSWLFPAVVREIFEKLLHWHRVVEKQS